MILVTGAQGQLGSEFCSRLGARALGIDLPQVDLTDRGALQEFVKSTSPEAVIHCAAYTAVDAAETNRDLCFRINADAVETLAATTAQLGIPLVQISTDYVFGGDTSRSTPYSEGDTPAPQGVYAASKLAGEVAAALNPRHLVVRTCGLYAAARPGQKIANFVQTMLRLGRERDALRVVNDQTCSPTFVPHLAAAALYLLESNLANPRDSRFRGLFNIVNTGAVTWHALASEIFRQAKLSVRVDSITTAEYNATAPRPAYSVLDTAKYHALGGPTMPTWQAGIAAYLAAAAEHNTA